MLHALKENLSCCVWHCTITAPAALECPDWDWSYIGLPADPFNISLLKIEQTSGQLGHRCCISWLWSLLRDRLKFKVSIPGSSPGDKSEGTLPAFSLFDPLPPVVPVQLPPMAGVLIRVPPHAMSLPKCLLTPNSPSKCPLMAGVPVRVPSYTKWPCQSAPFKHILYVSVRAPTYTRCPFQTAPIHRMFQSAPTSGVLVMSMKKQNSVVVECKGRIY